MDHRIWLLISVWLLTSCQIECGPEDRELCNCGVLSYWNRCSEDGYWPECECYNNGGDGIYHVPPEQVPDYSEPILPTPEENPEELLDYFPECPNSPKCSNGEVPIPCTSLCWRKCPVGMEWSGAECTGFPEFETHQVIEGRCKQYDQRYRFPTMEETALLLNRCYLDTFNHDIKNMCSSFLGSALSYVIAPRREMFFDTWVGPIETCIDRYGIKQPACAWTARLYITIIMDTEFDWLYASSYGSALSGGMCIRSS